MKAKNVKKYQSYAKAFDIITNAIRNDDFVGCLASICIVESIISDRLYSFLQFHNNLPKEAERHPILAQFIKNCKQLLNAKISVEINTKEFGMIKVEDLITEVDKWRDNRNKIVHSMVKSKPTEPTIDIEEFIKLVKESAFEGYKLSRCLLKWFQQQKINKLSFKV